MLKLDKKTTRNRKRIENLHKALGIKPTKGKFRCNDFDCCRKSLRIRSREKMITGSWPYVGVHYGKALVQGKRINILIVGMDAGGINDASTNFYKRQNEWRCAFENAIENPVSPHPTGTSLLVRELVDEKQPNRFARQFAFTNAVKCGPVGNMTSRVNRTMQTKCQHHLCEEIRTLQPNLIITQGKYPKEMIQAIMNSYQIVFRSNRYMIFRNGEILVISIPHPTRSRSLKWTKGIIPRYYKTAAEKIRTILVNL